MMRNLILGLVLVATVAAAQDPFDVVRLRARDAIVRGRSQFPTSGLVAYWSMRSSGATVFDEYGTNTGTAVNSPTFGNAYGVRNDGVLLNGTNQYITIGDKFDLLLSDYSWSFWIQSRNAALSQRILQKGGYDNPVAGWSIMINEFTPRVVQFQMSDGITRYLYTSTTNNLLTNNVWSHVAITLDRDLSIKIYINGIQDQSLTPALQTTSINTTKSLWIGMRDDASAQPFNGSIDEIAIWNRALTSNEVFTLYSTPQYYP